MKKNYLLLFLAIFFYLSGNTQDKTIAAINCISNDAQIQHFKTELKVKSNYDLAEFGYELFYYSYLKPDGNQKEIIGNPSGRWFTTNKPPKNKFRCVCQI